MARTARKPKAHAEQLPEPTREQLLLAYRHHARPGWPPFEAALLSWAHRPTIYELARRMRRPAWIADPSRITTLPRGAYIPPTPPAEPPHRAARPMPHVPAAQPSWMARPPSRVGAHDAKRAAANDTED